MTSISAADQDDAETIGRAWIASPADAEPDIARAAAAAWAEFLADAGPAGDDLAELASANPALATGLGRVLDGAHYLKHLSGRDPERLLTTLATDPDRRVRALIAGLGPALADTAAPEEAMAHLRRFKNAAALTIALADLGRVRSVDWVTEALSDVADTAIRCGLDFLFRRAMDKGHWDPPDPDHQSRDSGLIVLAMGKHGARELNFSSDVDLIIFFEETAPVAASQAAQTFFVRLTRDLVKLLQERTEHGMAFRMDLRLRPDPGATQVAISLGAAFQYYESLGQNWERAALIKARPCAGDIAAGERFLKEISPFIWRKYMDFNALADVHAMKRQIHAHKGHGQIAALGHNVKLGRGGIREIEFFVQTQQLIGGGRHPEFRDRRTLEMLARLASAQWIEDRVAEDMAECYRFLRRVEHALQMVGDEQTHTLPADEEVFGRFARFAGFASGAALKEELLPRLERVQRHYARLFESAPSLSAGEGSLVFTGDADDPETIETLSELGYRRPSAASEAIRAWHFGRFPATRSGRARERLTELMPALLEALAKTSDPDAAFAGFDRFLRALPTGIQVFSLLKSNPHLLGLLAEVLGTAPVLAETLSRRPRVLEALLEPDFFISSPTHAVMAEWLGISLGQARSIEDVLDRARIFGREHRFLTGVKVLSDAVKPAEAATAYAAIADVLVTALHGAVAREFSSRHGEVPGGVSAVVAMGKFGGCEMTPSSDLDLLLLYDHDSDARASTGPKELAPSTYFVRLTQRLVAALAAPTGEGSLYEVDMRLRPSGNAGPLATHLDGFIQYQRDNAWVWEHMALTRARVVSAPGDFGGKVETAIRETLSAPRDRARVCRDVLEMRTRIHDSKGSDDPWDIKTVRGGLVDLEFVAQYLQLVHAHGHPDILHQRTGDALEALGRAGLIGADDTAALLDAGRFYQALTQLIRLVGEDGFQPDEANDDLVKLLLRTGECDSLDALSARLLATQEAVDAAAGRLIV